MFWLTLYQMDKLNKIIESYSPELKLLLAICGSKRWNVDELVEKVDWDEFINKLNHHKIYYHTYAFFKLLKNTPDFVNKYLYDRFKETQSRSLIQVSEIIKINKLFQKHACQVLFYKGPVLSQELYKDACYRFSKDIDILIKKEDIQKVDNLLLEAGYIRLFNKKLLKKKIYFKLFKDIGYYHPENKIFLEIHWSVLGVEKLYTKNFDEMYAEKRGILIGSSEVNTFSKDDLFEYLLMHGTMHKWFRLFWVRDIVDFIKVYPEYETMNLNKVNPANGRTHKAYYCFKKLLFESSYQSFGCDKKEYVLTKLFIEELKNPKENISRNIFCRVSRFFYFMRLSPELRVFDFMRLMFLSIGYYASALFLSKKEGKSERFKER